MENCSQISIFNDLDCEQSVSKTIKKKKRKPLEIKVEETIVELNLLILPLVPIGKSLDVGEVVVKWFDSENNQHGIKISMPENINHLTIFDIKVLMTLLKIYSEYNTVITYNIEKENYEMPMEIRFTKKMIVDRLKYKQCGGSITRKIDTSLDKLSSATISSMFNGGLYDVKSKKWITNSSIKYHIFDICETYNYRDVQEGEKRILGNHIKDTNRIIINRFFYDSLCSGYCRIINYDFLIKIKSDVAYRIYALLEGWFCDKRPFVYFKYETLYNRIPLPEIRTTSNKNRDIKNALEELVKLYYIDRYIIKKGKGVYIIFDSSINDDVILNYKDKFYGLDKYNSYSDVVNALLNYGISANDIDLYVKDTTKESNLEYIKALLRYFDVAMRYDRIDKNPVKYLLKGLQTTYDISQKYYSHRH